jgi:hypothetical protein
VQTPVSSADAVKGYAPSSENDKVKAIAKMCFFMCIAPNLFQYWLILKN